MADYSIASQAVPLGGRAVATLNTFDAAVQGDVDSVMTTWRDSSNVVLKTLTRTTVDQSSTDIHGNAVTLSDIGSGLYQATLVIDSVAYSPPASGLTFSLQVTVVKGAKTAVSTFTFRVIPTTLTVSLDSQAIALTVMRQTGLLLDKPVPANTTNTILSLGNEIVYSIHAAYKNGVSIVAGTDYTWTLYRSNVTLSPAPAVGDTFVFVIQTRSDAFINDIVNRHIADVRRALKPHYDTDSVETSPSVVEIIKSLCIGQLRQDLTQGVALDSAYYRAGRDLQLEARMQLLRIQRGEEDIYDTDGAPVSRRSGSIVGGFRHADGDFVNRLGLQDRIQQHTGLYVGLYPDPITSRRRTTLSTTGG